MRYRNYVKSPTPVWQKIKHNITLKNFTILSIILIIIGIVSSAYFPQFPNLLLIQTGIVCFLLAYFLYALKYWQSSHPISAVMMLTIPLFIYFLSTTKIPDLTTETMIDIVVQLCLYAIISIILLFVSDKIKRGINSQILKNNGYNRLYFHPNFAYTIMGIGIISLILVNFGSQFIFSENIATFKNSFQNPPSASNSYSNPPVLSTTIQIPHPLQRTQNPTIIPTTIQKSDYKNSPKTTSYSYVINGIRKSIGFTTYGGLSDYFSKEDHSYYNDMEKETIMELLENDYQDENIRPLIESIRKSSASPNDQAKTAISLVQHIPYNWNAYYGTSTDWNYPYETLYKNKGVCADKSLLLAYLLNELGYDTVLFEFSNHMAIGIKSSSSYDFYDTGYAFVETTRPTIITYIPDTYLSGFRVTSNPHIIHLIGGNKALDVSTEYQDATRMKQLEAMGSVLDQNYYAEWLRISNNYDLQYDT